MTTDASLQSLILNQVLLRFSKKSDAISKLEEVLSLKREAISRRLRGDTILSPQEIQTLAIHFNLSIDELLFGNTNRSLFVYNLNNQPINSFLDYLHQVHFAISSFKQKPNFEIRYTSREIPIFIYMMYPKLMAFKLYVYGLTAWGFEYLQGKPFSFDLLGYQELKIAEEMSRMYCSIPSKDYWTVNILEQSLNQIGFMVSENRIKDRRVILELCDEVKSMVEHAQNMAKKGQKFLPGEKPAKDAGQFDLYLNEIVDTNNMILAVSDHEYGLYHTFNTPNFLFTSDQKICRSVEEWFDTTLGNATSISVHSAKHRNQYFNSLRESIQKAYDRFG